MERRYDVLMQLIETVMVRSRNELNTTHLVEMAYGDDNAAAFGGKEMLAGTMDDMLDKVHEQVLQQDKRAYLEQHGIEAMLDRLERTVARLDDEDAACADADRDDKESAERAASDANLLPEGWTLEDFMNYNNYQNALKQKEEMSKALQEIQEEIVVLENEQSDMSSQVESQQRVLQKTAQELNRSADICSMVVS